ncbi:MAG: hypothetical protein ABWX67_15555 [Allosphingosinicella sp.]
MPAIWSAAKACFAGLALAAGALAPTPEAAMSRFVTLNNARGLGSAEGKALLAGELDGADTPGMGELAPADRLVRIGADSAVARIPATAGGAPDLYWFLARRGDGWSLVGMRTLALTGIVAESRRLLRALPTRTAEQEADLRNAELTLAPDRELLAWAAAHRALLAQVRAAPGSAEADRAVKAAGGHDARREGGIVFLSIGGILDNEVGFLFPLAGPPPMMDASGYIWIEPAVDGWYLFKTT